MSDDTLIFTCAGGGMMSALGSRLKATRPGRRLIGADMNPAVAESPPAGFDRIETVPGPDDPDYAERLISILSAYTPAVLVPGSDEEAEALAPHAERLRACGLPANLSPPGAIAAMRDKYRFARVAARAGCAVPRTLRADCWSELADSVRALGYPERSVVVKPARGRGRRNTFFADREARPVEPDVPPSCPLEDMEESFTPWPGAMLASERITGQALTVDLLCSNGRLEAAVVRRWLGPGRFPFPGQEIIERPELATALEPLLQSIGAHGLLDADLIEDEDRRGYLLEINPRPSGSAVAAVAAGIPVFDLMADIVLERELRPVPVASRKTVLASDLLASEGTV